MKNILKFFGIIVLVTVIGFSMTACEEDEDCKHTGTAKITITDLSEYNNEHAMLVVGNREFWGTGKITSGSIAIEMLCWECDQPDFKAGTYDVALSIADTFSNLADDDKRSFFGIIIPNKTIPAGNSSLKLSDFTPDSEI
jgi:hypothetical protein